MLKGIKMKPEKAHVFTNGTVTLAAFVTLIAHGTGPLEAVLFFVTGVMAVWAPDVERALRHPGLIHWWF